MDREHCNVCGSSLYHPMYESTLFRCSSCKHIWANYSLSFEQLQAVYGKNYFHGDEYSDYIEEKRALQINFKKRLNHINHLNVGINEQSNVLEIGCAYGFFGELVVSKCKPKSYIGFDISKEATKYGRNELGLDVRDIDYSNYNPDNTFSHVFMWDVIEHLNNPRAIIEKTYRDLEEGGFIAITTGDINSKLARIQKQNWRMIHPPSHLHYFTKESLSKLLISCGFKIVEVSYPWIYRRVYQMVYRLLGMHNKSNGLRERIMQFVPKDFYIPLNTFDIMFLIAKKI